MSLIAANGKAVYWEGDSITEATILLDRVRRRYQYGNTLALDEAMFLTAFAKKRLLPFVVDWMYLGSESVNRRVLRIHNTPVDLAVITSLGEGFLFYGDIFIDVATNVTAVTWVSQDLSCKETIFVGNKKGGKEFADGQRLWEESVAQVVDERPWENHKEE